MLLHIHMFICVVLYIHEGKLNKVHPLDVTLYIQKVHYYIFGIKGEKQHHTVKM